MLAHKRSSTFSSDGLGTGLAVFALTLVASVLFVELSGAVPRDSVNQWDRIRPPPSSGQWYLAYDQFPIDHYVLYHGLGEAIDRARSADVLIVGNSMVQFMFPYESLARFRDDTDFHVYNLALGYAESSAFVKALIAHQALAPQVVVVGTHLFFRGRPSSVGRDVIAADGWDARKMVFEHTTASRVRYGLFGGLRRWQTPVGRGWPIVLYRSTEYGSWYVTRERVNEQIPIPREGSATIRPEELLHARAFRDSLAEMGTELVLLHVPFGAHSRAAVRSLADSLGVFAITPDVPGLLTRDTEHLTDRSGRRYAEAALRELVDWMRSRHMTPNSKHAEADE